MNRATRAACITPWMWSTAETIAAHRSVYQRDDVPGGLADHLSGLSVALLELLRGGVPADQREAAILCLGLMDALGDVVHGDWNESDRNERLGGVLDGLARVALLLAPSDPGERAVFDEITRSVVGEGHPLDVMALDYATGEAVTRADLKMVAPHKA